MKTYVFDTNAVITYFDDADGSDKVESVFESAESKTATVCMSAINLGEVFYVTWKKRGETEARLRVQQIIASPVSIISADLAETLKAAEMKAKYRCGLAVAFAASLALSKRATLVTADPDFRKFGDKLRVMWLPSRRSIQ